MGIDIRIMTVCASDTEILVKIDRNGGHFGKWRKCRVHPNIFLGNMPNIIQTGLLKKMIPLAEDLGGAWWAPLAHGLLYLFTHLA